VRSEGNPARIGSRCGAHRVPGWLPWFASPYRGQLLRYDGELHYSAPTVAARAGVITLAERARPALTRDEGLVRGTSQRGSASPTGELGPLPGPPPGTPELVYRDDPAAARRFAREQAVAAGLTEPRLTDLVIAVGELAANTLRHTHGPGLVRLWTTVGEVICEVSDTGYIHDDLAGHRCPAADAGRGHGLWVVHQVCDRVEVRSGAAGTVFRLHLGL
jgi:anti-sigma regulatory factor (Ser/Thr protein kinase)